MSINRITNKKEPSLIEMLDLLNHTLEKINSNLSSIAFNQRQQQQPKPSVDGIWGSPAERRDKLQIQVLKKELDKLNAEIEVAQNKRMPKYDHSIPAVIINNEIIKLSRDSNESRLCRTIFKNFKTIKKVWSWDEIAEEWGEDLDSFKSRTIYNAGKRLNTKIASNTGIKDFFEVTLQTIHVRSELVT